MRAYAPDFKSTCINGFCAPKEKNNKEKIFDFSMLTLEPCVYIM